MERTSNNGNAASRQPVVHGARPQLSIKDFLASCLVNWRWFLVSVVLLVGVTVLYLKRIPPTYSRTASILIKVDDKSNASTDAVLEGLGIKDAPTNVTNEIQTLQSISIASEVVKRLHLDVEFYHDGVFHKELVYGDALSVNAVFEGLNNSDRVTMVVNLNEDGTVTLSDINVAGVSVDGDKKVKMGEKVKLTKGVQVTVSASPYYKKGMSDRLELVRSNMTGAMGMVQRRLSASLSNAQSSIIDITYQDVSTARAENILNTVVSVYNENWMKERNQQTVSTNEFIKERLNIIEDELGNVDQNISDYKSSHLLPDVQQVGSMAMAQANEAEQQSNTLNNQLYMARYIRSYLTDGRHVNQLLPSNSGIENPNIESQIAEYNDVLLRRNNHLANSSAQNPLVMDLEQNLSVLRRSIIQSLDNEMTMLNTHKSSVNASHGAAVAKMASNPQQAKYLLSVERQQKVKESLYLFLLQKREENELSQAFTAYNTQLLDPPHGSNQPTAPQTGNALVIALAIGLLLPAGVIFLRESSNTKVRGRKDLEQCKVPFVGEIPQKESPKKKRLRKHPHAHLHEKPEMLVGEGNRDMINEAFRVVRSNLEFMVGFDSVHQVIMLTSINVGSGKTFISANLSMAMAIKDKKVLAVDLDLRKRSLSKYVGTPEKGVSNYLSGQLDDLSSLIVHCGKLDVLPCGTLPPNPAELLSKPRFATMIETLKKDYDYVFLDCPPVEIVADSHIIAQSADLTLFIARANLMDLALLTEIDRWYEEKKFKNLSLVLNGTGESTDRYGYHYGYGHQYGYHYGYHYVYGEKSGKKHANKLG